MFSKPKYGWTTLTIEDFSFTASYLTDVPNDICEALTIALNKKINTFVTLDGENNGECEVLFNMSTNSISFVAYSNDFNPNRIETPIYKMSVVDFAKLFVEDIEKYKTDWENWYDEDCKTKINLEPLKRAIKKYEKNSRA